MAVNLSGLASGFDWLSFIDQMLEVERTPQTRLRSEQSTLQSRNSAYTNLKTHLESLSAKVDALKSTDLYDSRTATSSDETFATATAADGAAAGVYSFNVTQLATAARQTGTAGVGAALSATTDVSGVVLSSAPFSSAIAAGMFTVNGHQVTVESTDTLQGVFDKISTATSGAVTAAYDPAQDKITLSSASQIVLGSAVDTSNFLQVARLYNNGTGSVASTAALGGVKLGGAMNVSNLAVPVTDGGSGAGEFKINGVSISFNTTTESLSAVIQRINDANAGVTATYDSINDRFVLTNRTAGDVGIALEDVTGNFLAATGLSGGAFERGKNFIYTLDNGGELVSQGNTIGAASSGITGLSVTALKEGTFTVTVGNDTEKIKTALDDFLTAYNKVQSYIDTATASSTDAKGKVTAGVLATEDDATRIASQLRSSMFSAVPGLAGVINHLEKLGISTSGDNNNLTLEDDIKLTEALTGHLGDVKTLFADTTNGLAVKLSEFIEKTIGDDGTLVEHQDRITKQISEIDTQIADMERIVQSNRQRMVESFTAMETAQAKINQQLTYLQQQLAST